MGVLKRLKKGGDECMVDGKHGKGGEVCTAVPTAIVQKHGRNSRKVLSYKKINNLANVF